MSPIGQRGYDLAKWSLWCGTVLTAFAIDRKADLVSAAALISGMLTAACGPAAARAWAEWNARAKDQSSIAEQTKGA